MIILFGLIVVFVLFTFVLFFGAPYLPTRREQVEDSFKLLGLKKGQTFYELGSGDGRLLKEAGKRGYNAVGYELNPILVLISRLNTYKYRKNVKTKWGSFWGADLSKADGVYVFLLDKYMQRLDKKIEKECVDGVAVVSFAFKIPSKKIKKKIKGLFLYEYK